MNELQKRKEDLEKNDPNYSDALHKLGKEYLSKGEESESYKDARLCIAEAAHLNHKIAQYDYGMLSLNENIDDAYYWFCVCAAQGYYPAIEQRDQLANKIKCKEIIEQNAKEGFIKRYPEIYNK